MNIYNIFCPDFYPFDKMYPEAKCITIDDSFKDFEPPGFLVLWGGMDIHPSLYNRTNIASKCLAIASGRDQEEAKAFMNAFDCNMPIVGICRGAQLCCAMSGGILIQDVQNHDWEHAVLTNDGQRFDVSSEHHQMMYPWDVPHELLAWTTPPKSLEYLGITPEELIRIPTKEFEGYREPMEVEPEAVWFPQTKALAFQWHPEWHQMSSRVLNYTKEQIDRFIVPKNS